MVWRGRCRDGGGAVREAAVRGNGGAEQGGVGGGGSVHGQDGGVWRWRRRRGGGAGGGVSEAVSEDLQTAQQSQFHGQGGDFAGGCQLVTGEVHCCCCGIKGW